MIKTREIINKICKNIVEEYGYEPNVLGILLFGSVVKRKFDKYSDVDLYVLLKKKGVFSRRNFEVNGLRVDIIINTLKEARRYLKEDENNLRRITSNMLANSKVLFRRGGTINKIRVLAKNNLKLKTSCGSSEVLMHKYSIDDFWGDVQRDIKSRDYLALGLDSHLLITNIIELRLKLGGKFLKQPNELGSVLRSLDKNFYNQVEKFYKARKITTKRNILSGLVKYIYKKSKGPLPKRWEIK